MKSDIDKTIDAKFSAAFSDVPMASKAILKGAEDLVRAVWIGKIYAALPQDKTTIPEYFLDAELEQFLNEAIEECYAKICSIAEQAKRQL